MGGKNSQCATVGCSAKLESISDVCERLRNEYAASGRMQWGISEIVRYNHKPFIGENGDWWPTQRVGRIKLREVCYTGIELKTTSSWILESVRRRPLDDHVPTSKPSLVN